MYSIPFVVLLGMGIVFVGLVSIIFLTMLMSYVLMKQRPADNAISSTGTASEEKQQQKTERDMEFISAVFTVLADDLRMDLTDARITVEKL